MVQRLFFFALLIFLVSATAAESAPVNVTPGHHVEVRWGLGAAYGQQWYGREGSDTGTVGGLQLTYRAYVQSPREGRWLFELGLEHARSDEQPEVADGEFRSLRSSGVFYRFNRFIGKRFYLGGRLGLSRVRGTEEKSNLDLVVGLQTGVRITSWLDAGIEFVSSHPSISDLPGQPGDVRGLVTLSF